MSKGFDPDGYEGVGVPVGMLVLEDPGMRSTEGANVVSTGLLSVDKAVGFADGTDSVLLPVGCEGAQVTVGAPSRGNDSVGLVDGTDVVSVSPIEFEGEKLPFEIPLLGNASVGLTVGVNVECVGLERSSIGEGD